MTFQYVDRILEYVPGKTIRGIKYVTRDEPFLSLAPDGRKRLRETIVVEALAQLGSWMAMADSQFKMRPLFLGEDLAVFGAGAFAGDRLDMKIDLLRTDDEVVETAGLVTLGDQVVLKAHSAKGFLMPMTDFADPKIMARRFQLLSRPETPGKGGLPGTPTPTESPFYRQSRVRPVELVDGIISHTPRQAVEAFKNIASTETFFEEHFPLKQIVPGVILLHVVCDVCEHLFDETIKPLPDHRKLTLNRIVNGRFRKMVTPGDQCVIKATVKKFEGTHLEVSAVVLANGTRVCQAQLEFQVDGDVAA